ncbi:MAG: hypothetical protein IKV98_05220 [Clostridia bacterium]|nr:hypothetical protein [Clostridia bacterium]
MEKRTIHTDILVAGSGPSGFAAAIAAKNNISPRNVKAEDIRKIIFEREV